MPQKSQNGGELVRSLPSWYPKTDDSDLFSLIDVIGHRFDEIDDDIAAIDRATTVQHADTVSQIQEQARMVSLAPRSNEGKESYRSRVLAEYQLNTCEGTVEDILTITSEVLNVDPEILEFGQSTESGVVNIVVPGEPLSDLNMSLSDLSDIINDLIAAGYRVDLTEDGTLDYTDPATYDSTSDWSNTPGYDTLDGSGTNTPEGTGGTYAGLL